MTSKMRDDRGIRRDDNRLILNQPVLALLTDNEEPHNPLKTNLSVNGIEVFLIEDGIKSSKDKAMTDGRLSSMGNEIFASRIQKPSINATVLKENKSPSKRDPLKASFNSTPIIIHKRIQTQTKKPNPIATQNSLNRGNTANPEL